MYNYIVSTKEVFNKTNNMCTFIRMEYLVASALVELYEKKKINKVSIDDIKQYGFKVEKILVDNNVNAVMLYSNSYMREFLDDYSDYFEYHDDEIYIKDGVTVQKLRDCILSSISMNMLSALLSEQSLRTIHSYN